MKAFFVVFFVFLSGCSSFRIESGYGGDLGLVADIISDSPKPGTGVTLDTVGGSALFSKRFDLVGPILISFEIGPTILSPLDPKVGGVGFGGMTGFRPVLSVSDSFEVYLLGQIGYSYFTKKWIPQTTNDGFIINAGIGVSVKVIEKRNGSTWWSIDYRTVHESNGSRVFGRGGENPGFNSDAIYSGIEWRFGK